jgi:hypothetical protein
VLEDGLLSQNMEESVNNTTSLKLGKETSDNISKYRAISLINTAAEVLEKVLINRIMHHTYSNNLTSKNQYGFTPQTSTVDAVMAQRDFVHDSLNGQYVALISFDVKGAFDAAWWPSIVTSLDTKMPKKFIQPLRELL